MSKSLIITADDFGICKATNEAIQELVEKKRITSTSLMLPGKAVVDAANRAQTFKDVGIGLHVTLTSDFCKEKWKSNAPQEMVEAIVDEDGFFHTKLEQFYELADSAWVITELAAQYSKGEALGIDFDHLDSHDGALYGLSGTSFLAIVFHFCATHRLAFRFPRKLEGLEHMIGAVDETMRQAHIEGALFAAAKKVCLPDFVISNPLSNQQISSYEELKQVYLDLLKDLPTGVTELFLHPSKKTSEYYRPDGEWQKRVWEYEFLMDDDFIQTLEEEGIKLVTWKEAFVTQCS